MEIWKKLLKGVSTLIEMDFCEAAASEAVFSSNLIITEVEREKITRTNEKKN